MAGGNILRLNRTSNTVVRASGGVSQLLGRRLLRLGLHLVAELIGESFTSCKGQLSQRNEGLKNEETDQCPTW